jgi:hypothetical protein
MFDTELRPQIDLTTLGEFCSKPGMVDRRYKLEVVGTIAELIERRKEVLELKTKLIELEKHVIKLECSCQCAMELAKDNASQTKAYRITAFRLAKLCKEVLRTNKQQANRVRDLVFGEIPNPVVQAPLPNSIPGDIFE